MKKIRLIIEILILATMFVLAACKEDSRCFSCDSPDGNPGTGQSFCMDRNDAVDRKNSLEAEGFTCIETTAD